MHYYQFNISDYQSHTKHLTPIEDICYRRLLDWQYMHEKPISTDITAVCRLLMLRDYPTDVEQVLSEFFILTEEGWINSRAFEEIEQYIYKSKKASEAGKASAAKRSLSKPSTENQQHTLNSEQTFNDRSTTIQPTINYKPLTINQEQPLKPIDQKSGDFDRFWEKYPKKTAKIEAQKAWKKAKPDLNTVLEALAWQIKSRQWLEGYVPNPATYLNGGRWMDTPVNERTTKPDIILEKNRNNVEEWIPPEMRAAL